MDTKVIEYKKSQDALLAFVRSAYFSGKGDSSLLVGGFHAGWCIES